MSEDDLGPSGARPSAGTVMINSGFLIYRGPVLVGLKPVTGAAWPPGSGNTAWYFSMWIFYTKDPWITKASHLPFPRSYPCVHNATISIDFIIFVTWKCLNIIKKYKYVLVQCALWYNVHRACFRACRHNFACQTVINSTHINSIISKSPDLCCQCVW